MSFAEACSIALKSGLQGGRKRNSAPVASMAAGTAAALWQPRLSITATLPGASVGARTCHIGQDGRPVHRAVDHHRCGQTAEPEPRYEARRAPMAMGEAGEQPLAAAAPAMQARHLRVQPGLVDEDEALEVEVRLRLEPGEPRRPDVLALLLAGVAGRFSA